jgi:predicted  nucleic acid-binding Zn-ribbon protein
MCKAWSLPDAPQEEKEDMAKLKKDTEKLKKDTEKLKNYISRLEAELEADKNALSNKQKEAAQKMQTRGGEF